MLNLDHEIKEVMPGALLVTLNHFRDQRGSFVKTFNRPLLNKVLPAIGDFDFQEEFYSVSNNKVLRGMHFQLPPNDHDKIVICLVGVVRDVLVDLRLGTNFGNHAEILLDGDKPQFLFIPKGIAHGFLSLSDKSLMVYKTSSGYSELNDSGIRYDSFGYDWQTDNLIISERDKSHARLDQLRSPF